MKQYAILVLCSILFVSSACTNIKSKKVTEENKENILTEIQTSKDLTDEERQLLAGYVMRHGIASIFRGGKPAGLPVGKTIGEMLDEQRKWIAKEKQEEEKQKQLAVAVAAKQAELRNIIGVALYSFVQKQGSFMDYVEVGYAYENRSTKDVRAFEGEILYRDVLGNKLEEIPLKVLKPIKAGEKGSTSDRHSFMAYGGLRDKKLDDVKIEWQPKKILFADGTTAEITSQ